MIVTLSLALTLALALTQVGANRTVVLPRVCIASDADLLTFTWFITQSQDKLLAFRATCHSITAVFITLRGRLASVSKSEQQRGWLRGFQQFSRLHWSMPAKRSSAVGAAAMRCRKMHLHVFFYVCTMVWLRQQTILCRCRNETDKVSMCIAPSEGLSLTRPVVAEPPSLAWFCRGRASLQLLPWRHIMLMIAQKCFSTSSWKLIRSAFRGRPATAEN